MTAEVERLKNCVRSKRTDLLVALVLVLLTGFIMATGARHVPPVVPLAPVSDHQPQQGGAR